MPIVKNEYVPVAVSDTFEVVETGTLDPMLTSAVGVYRFHNSPAVNLAAAAAVAASAILYICLKPTGSAAATAAELVGGLATITLSAGDTLDVAVENQDVYVSGVVAGLIITYQRLVPALTAYEDA